jgi:hypothetical protein
MAFFGLFKRKPPIREPKDLADFIDAHAAFLMQKGIYEYSRARAGPHANKMMSEPGFATAVEEARWRAYPLGLSMVGEMVEGVLRPHAGPDKRALTDDLTDLVLSAFDRYPVPPPLGKDAWLDARSALALSLDRVSLHPPKRVIDIPEQYVQRYFAMMPIHKDMLSRDIGTTLNFLKLNLANMHDDLTKRMNAAEMLEKLRKAADAA